MKRFLTLGFLMCAVALFFVDCSSDPCDDIFCSNGACLDGTCDCDEGFEGANCDQAIPCFNVNCNNGTCVDNICNCDEGFQGANCDEAIPCFNINCNNGTCEDNICNCELGYEGEFCDQIIRDKYLGSWSGPNTCDLNLEEAMLPDSIFIEISANADDIAAVDLLLNLDDLGDLPMETAVLTNGTFTVLPETIVIQGFDVNYEIAGKINENGILDVDTKVVVDVNGVPFPITCEAQLTKN